MYPVSGRSPQIVPDGHELQLSNWLDGIDPSKAPSKVRQEIEHVDPDKGVLSKAALMWLIGTHLTEGRKGALIALINKFEVPFVGVRVRTPQSVGILIALFNACPSLRGLGLIKAHVHGDEAQELASSLAGCRHVAMLELISCEMSPKAWRIIANRLPDMHGLECLHVQAMAGPWLQDLSKGIARSSSLTSLKLSLSGLERRGAALLGEALRGNRSLTSLAFDVKAGCDVAESFMKGLVAPAEYHREHDPLPRLAKLRLVAHPPTRNEAWQSVAETSFSEAFCDLLVRQIKARSALGFVRIEPGIFIGKRRVGVLGKALRQNLVEFDIKVRPGLNRECRDLSVLDRPMVLRKYQSLMLESGALKVAAKAAAEALLSSIPVAGESLPKDIESQIVPRMVGDDGSLRQRWGRRGWMQVNRAAYNAAAKASLAQACDRDIAIDDLMRLELSGIPLHDQDRARLREAFSPSMHKYTRRAANVVVREYLGLAKHLLKHGNPDGALFALKTLQRVVKDYQLKEPLGLGMLRARIALKR